MFIEVLQAKIHNVRLTQTELNYTGSITIDENTGKLLVELQLKTDFPISKSIPTLKKRPKVSMLTAAIFTARLSKLCFFIIKMFSC